jgi:hypothetical protein
MVKATAGTRHLAGGRRARPGGGLPPAVPARTRGGLRAVVGCAGGCIAFGAFVYSLEALFDQGPGARGGDGQ